ncbi:hypothetical protein VNO77_02540 [Canavalia gladiata]|uniref:Uncharacterized protein n=1 Tax=Canavalia gladiata TaxID=3824 RepID=A0AAN9MTU5_CANGL
MCFHKGLLASRVNAKFPRSLCETDPAHRGFCTWITNLNIVEAPIQRANLTKQSRDKATTVYAASKDGIG